MFHHLMRDIYLTYNLKFCSFLLVSSVYSSKKRLTLSSVHLHFGELEDIVRSVEAQTIFQPSTSSTELAQCVKASLLWTVHKA